MAFTTFELQYSQSMGDLTETSIEFVCTMFLNFTYHHHLSFKQIWLMFEMETTWTLWKQQACDLSVQSDMRHSGLVHHQRRAALFMWGPIEWGVGYLPLWTTQETLLRVLSQKYKPKPFRDRWATRTLGINLKKENMRGKTSAYQRLFLWRSFKTSHRHWILTLALRFSGSKIQIQN